MDDLPFRGQTFLVATSEDLADKVARAVRERGGRAIPFPTIRLVPPADYENLDRGLRLSSIRRRPRTWSSASSGRKKRSTFCCRATARSCRRTGSFSPAF